MAFDTISQNYVPKSFDDIFLFLLEKAFDRGLLTDETNFTAYVEQTMDIENTLILDLSVIALLCSYIYSDITRMQQALDIDTATGNDLDNLVKLYTQRTPPSLAVGEVTFDFDGPAGVAFPIPAGTVVATKGDVIVRYVTTPQEVMVAAENTSVTIPVRCLEYGIIGNIGAHEIDTLDKPLPVETTVDNTLGFTGGSGWETDDQLRGRGKNWKYALAKGTYDSYRDILDTMAVVKGWHLDKWWRGYGTTKIIIDPPTTQVVEMVTSAIGNVKAVDEDVTIAGVELVEIDASLIANVSIDEVVAVPQSDKDEIAERIKFYTAVYINGGLNRDASINPGMRIAQDYIPFQNNAYVLSQVPEIKNIEINYPIDVIVIGEHQKAVAGEITVQVI